MKKYFTLLSLFLLLIAVSIISPSFSKAGTNATTADDLMGYAWSDNMGWISFGGTSVLGTYGVDFSTTTGYLSGYAWADNVGWVSFNEETGCPDGSADCRPKADLTSPDNTVSLVGWGKVLAEGWNSDGWMRFSGTDHAVLYNKELGQFSGNAWGDEVGWIEFQLIQGPATTENISIPSVPGGFSANAVCLSGLPRINISYNAVSANPPATYKIGRTESGTETDFANFDIVYENNGISFEDDTVTPGTTYFYKVVAYNDQGESTPSATVSATASSNCTTVCSNDPLLTYPACDPCELDPTSCDPCFTDPDSCLTCDFFGTCTVTPPVTVGDVLIATFKAKPTIINKGGSCNLAWTINQKTTNTRCEIIDMTNSATTRSEFNPNGGTPDGFGSYSVPNIQKGTTYKLSCYETALTGVAPAPIVRSEVTGTRKNKFASCTINPNFVETK